MKISVIDLGNLLVLFCVHTCIVGVVPLAEEEDGLEILPPHPEAVSNVSTQGEKPVPKPVL